MAEVVLGITGAVGTAIACFEGSIHLVAWLGQRKAKASAKKVNISKLFGFIRNADVTIANLNPWVESEVHPDDKEALRFFKDWICDYFKEGRMEEYLNSDIGSVRLNKHLCSIGGPATHPYTRYTMGYDNKGENWIPILPFIYPLREAERKSELVLQERKGFQWKEPNWYIADSSGNPVYVPTVNEGILSSDYFMIIVAPNTFTESAFYSGQKHMMIASAHGVSQLAIKDILDNDDILIWLNQTAQKSQYFQAILEIPEIVHTRQGYVPKGKPIPRVVVPLDPRDFQKLKKYKEWI